MTELRQHFDEIFESVKTGETVILTRYGKDVAVMEPYRDEESIQHPEDDPNNLEK
jgi:prevent-host-death family protein